MPRPQFTMRALLVAMLVVAAFFGGLSLQRFLDMPVESWPSGASADDFALEIERINRRDGTELFRVIPHGSFRIWQEFDDDGGLAYHMRLPDGSHWQLLEE